MGFMLSNEPWYLLFRSVACRFDILDISFVMMPLTCRSLLRCDGFELKVFLGLEAVLLRINIFYLSILLFICM